MTWASEFPGITLPRVAATFDANNAPRTESSRTGFLRFAKNRYRIHLHRIDTATASQRWPVAGYSAVDCPTQVNATHPADEGNW